MNDFKHDYYCFNPKQIPELDVILRQYQGMKRGLLMAGINPEKLSELALEDGDQIWRALACQVLSYEAFNRGKTGEEMLRKLGLEDHVIDYIYYSITSRLKEG